MKQINKEILALLEKYKDDTKRALKENKRLSYLYALSELRENLLEWYAFKADASLLQVGADFGALTGLFSSRTGHVTVLDSQQENLDLAAVRHHGKDNISYEAGTLEAFSEHGAAGTFDYITIIGSLAGDRAGQAAQLEAAGRLLKPGGTLITAACNRLGMKYFAGAEPDENSITKKTLEQLLPGAVFYYPMPDYRVPSVLYSDEYLPKKGDLTKTLAVYDYPVYLLMDVGAYYDTVCEDGQFADFANSFLVFWEKGE